MKGLSLTFLVIAGIIVIAAAAIFAVSNNLDNSSALAHGMGYDQGYYAGYEQGSLEGTEAGYQAGVRLGFNESNLAGITADDSDYFLYNPTYSEVLLLLDQVDSDTARGIHDYARANGIRVAYVRAPIAREAGEGRVYLYQLVAFDTVDRGFLIFEPSSGREVLVEEGRSYSELNGFPESPYDDTVTEVTIVW